jgi:hypothetical protein
VESESAAAFRFRASKTSPDYKDKTADVFPASYPQEEEEMKSKKIRSF